MDDCFGTPDLPMEQRAEVCLREHSTVDTCSIYSICRRYCTNGVELGLPVGRWVSMKSSYILIHSRFELLYQIAVKSLLISGHIFNFHFRISFQERQYRTTDNNSAHLCTHTHSTYRFLSKKIGHEYSFRALASGYLGSFVLLDLHPGRDVKLGIIPMKIFLSLHPMQ